ncbi:MAG: hypothetical protein NTX03_05525 [Bacteroidetes bacterium]|nr:hypothetical protein [Bacteroidota bacterium]
MIHKFKLLLLLFISIVTNTYAQQYSWEKLNTDPYRGKQDDIYFVDENRGWYINGYGKIYHTTNGGETSTMQLEKKGTFFRCVSFIDSLRGFVGTVGTDYFPNVTDSIPLYKTIDGGKNWTPVSYSDKYVKGLCAMDIVKEEFVNHGEIGYKYHIYGVGRVGSPANFIVSHDGGNTFTSMDMSSYCSALYDIKMFNKEEGFACASIGTDLDKSHACILHTTNAGRDWKKVYESQRPFEISWKVFFPSKKVGYATIQSYNPDSTVITQHFIKTKNGGKSWKENELCKDFKARSFGVGFIDENHGFIGTMNSGYQTTDGGNTWQKTDMGKACNKIRIVKLPNGKVYGYAIGVNVYRLKEKP